MLGVEWMTFHHVISQEDQLKTCPYCGKTPDIRNFRSAFNEMNGHYKDMVCGCGKSISIKVPFAGSGHDSWNKRFKDLDKRIEEEE